MPKTLNLSVVVVVKNEEEHIEDALISIKSSKPMPSEIIVIDGDSNDRTVEIAKKYTSKVFVSKNSNLTDDRQIGINKASNNLIAMIDADNRVTETTFTDMISDLKKYNLDIVQASVFNPGKNFWDKAETEMLDLIINVPGNKKMIGVAPNIYKKEIFEHIQFDSNITKTIDDTDFMYRLHKLKKYRLGSSPTRVVNLHTGNTSDYIKKFIWYGVGDGEFCKKHKNRAFGMFFHLAIRYPILYPLKALASFKFRAIPFCMLQGLTRLYACSKEIVIKS
jgi:glycosyltransferase involved in cell wall biosynthesis